MDENTLRFIQKGLYQEPSNYELYLLLGKSYEADHPELCYLAYENAEYFSGFAEKAPGDRNAIQQLKRAVAEERHLQIPNVSIIILSYNTLSFTSKCIESIRRTVKQGTYELIVIDNASTDGSVEWLRAQPDVKLIANEENVGFPRGCNQGILAANPENDIFLLNSDTVLFANSLFYLRMGLYRAEDIGATGSVSNLHDEVTDFPDALDEIDDYVRKKNLPAENPWEEKAWLGGFAVLLRREALNEIGLLDEDFTPGYFEDNDIGTRLLQAGWKNILCHNSFILHYGSKSFSQRPETLSVIKTNQEKFLKKWGFSPIDRSVTPIEVLKIIGTASRDQDLPPKKIVLFGNHTEWEDAMELLARYYPEMTVYALCDPYTPELAQNSDAICMRDEIVPLYKSGEIDGVVNLDASIAIWNEYFARQGVTKNYAIQTKFYRMNSQEVQAEILNRYGAIRPELYHLEVALAEHCNLKCKGCTHFSNLVKEPVLLDIAEYERDLKRLAELFDNIKEFHLLGGEPLLHPDADKIIALTRQYFPYTRLVVVTNGLLIPTMKDELIRAIKENQAWISISNYDCLDEEKLRGILRTHRISYEIRNGKEYFARFLNPRADGDVNDVFLNCGRRNCTYLDRGRIAACPQPFMVHYFNQYYEKNFSEKGWISLFEDGVDGDKILAHLLQPMDACRYCTYEEEFSWGVSKEPVPMSDWCVGGKTDENPDL